MVKQGLLKQLYSSISDEEWASISKGTIEASEFNYKVLNDIKKLYFNMDSSDINLDKSVDEAKVLRLREILEDYLSKELSDKPQAWKWIITSCLYRTFIAELPMHPIDKVDIKVIDNDGKTEYACPAHSKTPGTCCDYCVSRLMTNYEITKRNVEREFFTYDHEALAAKRGLRLDPDYMYITFIDKEYMIDRKTGFVSCEGEEADFNVVLTLYDIICYSEPSAYASKEYILHHQLSKVQNASSYAGSGFYTELEKTLTGKEDILEEFCQSLGGIPYGKGDVSYILPFFDQLKVVLSYWSADEDFPAQLQFMLDKNTLQYMHYETTWYAIGHIVSRIKDLL